MTSKIAPPSSPATAPAPAPSVAAGRFLLVAQSLVILAFAAALSIQAGLHPLLAASAAVAVVLLLVAINRMISARATAASKVRQPLPKAAEPARPQARMVEPDFTAVASGPAVAAQERAPMRSLPIDTPPALAPVAEPRRTAPDALSVPQTAGPGEQRGAAMPPPMPRYSEAPVRTQAPVQQRQIPELPAYAGNGLEHDYWSHRPAQPRLDERRPHEQLASVAVAAAPAAPAQLRETDVEAIQTLIKKLADEVNLAEQARGVEPEQNVEAFAPAVEQTAAQLSIDLPPRAEPAVSKTSPIAAPVALEPDEAVAQSLAALRSTAGAMRQPSNLVFGHELPPPLPPPPSRATILAEAIGAGRADVLLEPILGLQSQEAEHFEVSIRLRAEDGSPLAVNAADEELRGTGLLPLFDTAKITRTVAVAERLADRGKEGSVFSTYSGEALADRAFLSEATLASRRQPAASASRFVLTFTQADARGFEAPEWAAIAHMRALGFRFALSQVTDLDMDLEGLVRAGFSFVKLDVDVFLVGLRSPAGLIPSADVCRHLAGLGLGLVVEHIDDETKFAQVYGFGALLGQGQLFGGARVLKPEAVAPASGRTAA